MYNAIFGGIDLIYFDNAATTFPKPKNVLKAVENAVTRLGGNPGRSGHRLSYNAAEKIYAVRKKYADFFGVQPENIVFCSNCTHALNMAIKGALPEGGRVVTSSLEHNSVIRPLSELSKKGQITFETAKVYENNDDLTLLAFESKINEKTKAVVATFASNVTGVVLPIKKLGDICRKRGVTFIVDAAQAAGILPVNMEEYGIDILCAAGHKSLYGITGTGIMAINTGKRLSTIIEGGTGSVSVSADQPDFLPDRFESGTVNTVGIMSMAAGLDFILKQGMEDVYLHEMNLCKQLYDELMSDRRFRLYVKNMKPGKKAPVLSFNIKGITSTEAVSELSDMGFALRGGFHCAYGAHGEIGTQKSGAIRFSPSVFNKPSEVRQLTGALYKIAKSR